MDEYAHRPKDTCAQRYDEEHEEAKSVCFHEECGEASKSLFLLPQGPVVLEVQWEVDGAKYQCQDLL